MRIEPTGKTLFYSSKHLLVNSFDICKLLPSAYIIISTRPLDLDNKFFHESQLMLVIVSEMPAAELSVFDQPVLCSQ